MKFLQYRDFPAAENVLKNPGTQRKLKTLRAKNVLWKNPGYRDFEQSWYWKKISNIFWPIFWSIFVHFIPLLTKRAKTSIFGKKPCIYTLPPFFFWPLLVDLLDAKGHFSCFSKKVSFMGGGKKKVVFSHFLFSIKKIHKFTVFRL